MTAAPGQSAAFTVKVAAIPDASYQWLRNGTPIRGATEAVLRLSDVKAGDAARYSVRVTNPSGTATSSAATLAVK
jgi:hypothetical protein